MADDNAFKLVAQLDENGYFASVVPAHESPLEPGVYLIPGGAVDTDAPETPAGQRAKWVDDGWAFEDIPITPDTPEDQLSASDLRQCVKGRIEAWRDEQEQGSIVFEHAGHRWDGGLKVRTRLQPVLSLTALPPGFFWTDHENVDVPVDMAALAALNAAHELAIVDRGFAIHMRQREMKAEIESMDAEALAAYVVGWPEPGA